MNLKKIKSDAKEQVKPYIKKLCPKLLMIMTKAADFKK